MKIVNSICEREIIYKLQYYYSLNIHEKRSKRVERTNNN